MAKNSSTYRTGIFAALTLAICAGIGFSSPARAADTQCSGTLTQYGAAVQQLQAFSAKSEALADQNPLYISDVEYYASALAQAQRCVKSLSTVATVSR